jgi:hypothetical protein
MRSRRKLVTVEPGRDNDLLKRILEAEDWTSRQVVAIEKDLLLIEAALETDRLVASSDSTVRDLFVQAAERVNDISSIVWVDPTNEEDDGPGWLRSGARSTAARSLRPPRRRNS